MTIVIDKQGGDVLLVVDVQNDFCPGGRLPIADGDSVVPVINDLAERFDHVVATQDWHPPGHQSFASQHAGKQPFETTTVAYGEQVLWPDHCIQGSDGAALHKELAADRAELIVRKGFRKHIDSYSAFYENDKTTLTGLRSYLQERGLKRVFVTGLAFDVCVRYSALDAAWAGFATYVIEDACRAVDPADGAAATRQALSEAGVGLIRSADLA